jgi:hypothetical protein
MASIIRPVWPSTLVKFRGFTPQGLANTMWGFACAGHNPGPEYLEAMKYAWLTEGQTYVVSECANLLWSFSVMKEHPG